MFTKNEILDLAIQLEHNAEKTYRQAAKQMPDQDLTTLLEWMADEELKHAKWFDDQKEAEIMPDAIPASDTFNQDFLNDMLQDQSFSLQDTDFSLIQNVKQLIAVFIEFERDTILFYELLTPFVENKEAQEQLQLIVAEENRHIDRLKVFLDSEMDLAQEPHIIN